MKSIKLLERTYFSFLLIVFSLVVFTPYIIRSGFLFIEEEILETVVIILLSAIGYAISRLYSREAMRNLNELENIKGEKLDLEDRLSDAFKYIGEVNVQIQEIKSAFSDVKKFPESKKDFKYILQFFSEKILSLVNVDWVIIRIVDIDSSKTLREYCETRGAAVLVKYEISNNDLLGNKELSDYKVITSSQNNFHIRTFCVIPDKKVNGNQETLIKAIINQLEMIFIIFSSNLYKNGQAQAGAK